MVKFLLAAAALLMSFSANATYKTYGEIKERMRMVAALHPDRITLFDLGMSDAGEMIQGLKFGSGGVKNLVVGTHHGNEYGSTELAMGFLESIALNPLKDQTIFVIPVLNISGYNARSRNERAVNGRSYDANRDYPGPCGTAGPYNLKSTAALAKFVETQDIVAIATLHTYSPAVVYPWGISSHDLNTAYTAEFTKMVQDATVESKYEIGNSTEVIYPADGTFEDFTFWKFGTWSILFEVGHSHSPSDRDVKETVDLNVPGMRRMFDNAPRVRAANHDFTGKCDSSLKSLDQHNE